LPGETVHKNRPIPVHTPWSFHLIDFPLIRDIALTVE
jgi:hypothetical protein